MVYKVDATGATVDNKFTNGNPSLGIIATRLEEDWHNMVQSELVNVVEAAGLTLDKLDDTQLLQSVGLINIQNSQTEVRCASELRWDGSKIYFKDNIEIVYRAGSGARRVLRLTPASAPSPNEITLTDGQVVVVAKDNQNTSPVTLTYQAVYASLEAGQWAIVSESSLTTDNAAIEMILFSRKDITPSLHYGSAQRTLTVVPHGHKYYDDAIFNLGASENILREYSDLYQQGCINGNMVISQRGNFTTAITSPALASNLMYLDMWSTVLTSGVDASLQKTAITITGTNLTNAQKLILNTSGGALTRRGTIIQKFYDVSMYAGKTVTFSFWLRSNQATNCRIFHDTNLGNSYIEIDTGGGDGVFRRYHFTINLAAGVTSFRFGVGLFAAGFTTYSVPAGAYVEFTGCRLHVGSDHFPEHYLSLQQYFNRCLPYCQGNVAEGNFNAGYCIYNINGVAKATWTGGSPGSDYLAFSSNQQIVDIGAVGKSVLFFPVSLEKTGTKNVYAFDNQATTNGGLNAAGRVSTKNSAGVDTNNVTPTFLGTNNVSSLVIEQTAVVGDGILETNFLVESFS